MKRSCVTGLVVVLATAFLAVVAPGTAAAADRATATQRRVVHSAVGMQVAPRARIVGEPRAVVVAVGPRRVRYVKVQQVRAGRWSTVARGHTDEGGRLLMTLPAPASLQTSYRAVVTRQRIDGTLFTAAASSAKPISRQLQHVLVTVPTGTAAGTAAAVEVQATPVRPGRIVRLQRFVRGFWRTAGNPKRESATGGVSFTVPTSTPGTVRLRAVVRAADGAPQAASHGADLTVLDTTAPAVPGDLSGFPGSSSAFLSWAAVPDSDLDHYVVYQREPLGVWSPAGEQPGSSTDVVVTGLSNGTDYEFAVTAVDGSGNESASSGSVTVTPSGCPPPPPVAGASPAVRAC